MKKTSRMTVLALGAAALAATTALAQQFVSYGNALDRNLGVNSGGSNSYTGRTIRSSASGMARDAYTINRQTGNFQYNGANGFDAPRYSPTYSVAESYGGFNGLSTQGMNRWSKPGTSTGYQTGLAQPGYSPQLFSQGGGQGYSSGSSAISNSARGRGGSAPPPRPGATPVSQSGETDAAASNVTYGRTVALQRYRVPLGNLSQADEGVISKLDSNY